MVTTTTHNSSAQQALTPLQVWWDDESGVTAIEYGLLAALIALATIGAFGVTGTSLADLYKVWSDAVVAALT